MICFFKYCLKLSVAFVLFFSYRSKADQIVPLSSPKQSLEARADLILKAKESIEIEYFSIDDDSVSISLLSLLNKAVSQSPSLKVRIIVDSLHNNMSRVTMSALISMIPSLEIKEYNQFNPLKFLNYSYRLHDKSIIIDGKMLIIGGRNIANSYFEMNNPNADIDNLNFEDNDVLVLDGESPKDAKLYFDTLWNSKLVSHVNLYEYSPEALWPSYCIYREDSQSCFSRQESIVKEIKRKQTEIIQSYQKIAAGLNLFLKVDYENNIQKKYENKASIASRIDFIHDPVYEKDEETGKLRQVLKGQFGTAQKIYNYILNNVKDRLVIVTPYLILTDEHKSLFKKLKERNVKIVIVTNSAMTNDVNIAQAGYELFSKKQAIELGINLFEYQGHADVIHPETLHAKLIYLDEDKIFAGSFNWNYRSQIRDREIGVLAEMSLAGNENFRTELKAKLESILSRSKYISSTGEEQIIGLNFNELNKLVIGKNEVQPIPRFTEKELKFWKLLLNLFGNLLKTQL